MQTVLKKRKKSGYGYIPDIADIRDFSYTPEKSVIAALPPKVDLTPSFQVYDQGRIGSCTANALAAAIQFERIHDKQSPEFIPSRLFIYYNERKIEGHVNYDSGAMIRDGIKVLHKLGVCPEKEWPYGDTPADQKTEEFPPGAPASKKPSDQCYKEARNYKITEYSRVAQDIDHLKACLAAGSPFVFGFSVYNSWVGNNSLPVKIPLPTKNDTLEGGHAVLCVGYDDEIRHFRIRNSWGNNVGENGYFWMPYEYIRNRQLADDFWVIKTVRK